MEVVMIKNLIGKKMVKEKYYGYCRNIINNSKNSRLRQLSKCVDNNDLLLIYDSTEEKIHELIKNFVCNSIKEKINNEY